MHLEANKNFKNSWTKEYGAEEFNAHLEKRNQGIDKELTIEEINAIRKSQTILPNLFIEDRNN